MNGLKYIRTKCNYSQRALAEVMGVSRQAINMWENSKKLPSKERKEIYAIYLVLITRIILVNLLLSNTENLKNFLYTEFIPAGRVNDLHLSR